MFFFLSTKQITTGEGGAIVTNDVKIYKKIKRIKAFGIDKDIKNRKIPGDYDVKSLGLNYRLTDFQAALGYNQIKNYSRNLFLRKKNAKRYSEKLKKANLLIFQSLMTQILILYFRFYRNIEIKLSKNLRN